VSKKKRKIFDLLIILLLGLISIGWFRKEFLIDVGDQALPLSPIEDFKKYIFYSWNSTLATGLANFRGPAGLFYYGFFAILEKIGLSLLISEKILFYFLFSLSGFSLYYLVTNLFNKNRKEKITSIFAALFYMFNPFALFAFWRNFTTFAFFYAIAPLILGLYIRLLNTPSRKYLLLLLLILILVFTSAAVNPAYVAILFFLLFSYLIFFVLTNIKDKNKVKTAVTSSIFLAFLWGMLNSWWIVPLVFNLKSEITGALAIGGGRGVFELWSSETSFLNLFRLLGPWPFLSFNLAGDLYFPWVLKYFTAPFLILGFIAPILAIFSFLKRPLNRMAIYFGLLFLLGLFLMKGMHSPFGQINEWVFLNIPGFEIFRNQYEKFGIIATLSYAVLVGMGFSLAYNYLEKFNRHIAQILIVILSILLFGVYMWPYWTGDIIFQGGERTPSALVRIPDYYFQIEKWARNREGEFKIISLPHQEGAAYSWDYGYMGSDDPTAHFLQKPLIAQTVYLGDKTLNSYLSLLFNTFKRRQQSFSLIPKLLGMTNVKYILVHHDINYYINTPDPTLQAEEIEETLENNPNIYYEKSFGKLDFYKLGDKYFLPHFYLPQEIVYSSNSADSLGEVVSFEDYLLNSGTYFGSLIPDENKNEVLNRANKIFVVAKPKEGVLEITEEEVFTLISPYTRWSPKSIVYPLILLKEKQKEKNLENWQDGDVEKLKKLIDLKLLHASKRIVEIEKFKNWGFRAGTDAYQEKIFEIIEVLEKAKTSPDESINQVFPELFRKVNYAIDIQKMKLEKALKERDIPEDIKEEKRKEIWQIFGQLMVRLQSLSYQPEADKIFYQMDIPQSGDYQLLIKNEEFSRYLRDVQLKLEILGEERTIPLLPENDNWITGGSYKLESGEQELKLVKPQTANLLGTDNWRDNLTESIFC